MIGRQEGAAPGRSTRVRRRNHQLNCEALEGRQMLSGYYIVNEASGKVLDNPPLLQQWDRHRSVAVVRRDQPAVEPRAAGERHR